MTIEEAEQIALAAAESGDLIALQTALKARAVAVAALVRTPPSKELASRLASAVAAGNKLHQKLSTLKARIRTDAARFAAIQAGCTDAIEAPSRTYIDCRG